MSILLISLATWGTALFAFKVAFTGNPVYQLLLSTPRSVIKSAANCIGPGRAESPDESVTAFLGKFMRFTLLGSLLSALELGLCFYFVSEDGGNLIGWFLGAKNLLVFIGGMQLQKRISRNPILAMLSLPRWVIRWDRVNYLVSGFCLVILLMQLHNVI